MPRWTHSARCNANHGPKRPSCACAWHCTRVRRVDKAFEWLETAYSQRDPGIVYTAQDRILDPLHSDPRWRPTVARLGLSGTNTS